MSMSTSKIRPIEEIDIKIHVTEKLSIMEKCLLAVFSKDEIGEIFESKLEIFIIIINLAFPYLLALNNDEKDESKYTFAR